MPCHIRGERRSPEDKGGVGVGGCGCVFLHGLDLGTGHAGQTFASTSGQILGPQLCQA